MATPRAKTKYPSLPDYYVGNNQHQGVQAFPFAGLVTALADPKKPVPGSYVSGKNWITGQLKDHMQLRGGRLLMGTRQTGAGKITGAGVGIRQDGVQVAFRSRGQKVEYYDEITKDWIEVGSNLLPAAASGEDVAFAPYNGLSGAFMFVSSPNSSIYKIPLANPGSAVDQNSTTYRGYIIISGGRTFLWNRKTLSTGFTDVTGLYLSYIDKATLSSFTTISGEAYGTGDGVTKTFTHSLAGRTGVRTVFGCTVTDGVETFADNKNGVMVGSLGGTGTINYATGAVSVTFNTAPALSAAITTTYLWEDSTSQGVCDFTSSGTRTVGQGDYFRQDDGGALMVPLVFDSKYYSFHALKAWVLSNLAPDDTQAANLTWRDSFGIPYWRGAYNDGDGITLLDFTDKNNPRVRLISYNQMSVVVLSELSEQLDLSPYDFSFCLVAKFSNYDLVVAQKKTLGVSDTFNSIMFVRNKVSGLWDVSDFGPSVLVIYNGNLLMGDSVSNNVFQIFSGNDDDGFPIPNSLTFTQMDLSVKGLKKTHRFEIDGYIAVDQELDIYLSYDGGSPILVGSILGTGAYVDKNLGAVIGGGNGIGTAVIGSEGAPNAFHFTREFTINSPRYEEITPSFQCTKLGACTINYFGFKDNRYKGRRKLPMYDS